MTSDQVQVLARVLCREHAEVCGVNELDAWKTYSTEFLAQAKQYLDAVFSVSGEPVALIASEISDAIAAHDAGESVNATQRATAVWLHLCAHPRPRVGVTEAMETLRSAMARVQAGIESALNEAYQSATPVCCGRPGDECCGSPDPNWDDASKAIMDTLGPIHQQLTAALALADEAAPGVVDTNEYVVINKHGDLIDCLMWTLTGATEYAAQQDSVNPSYAPHRVMRVCLKPLANGGGEVGQ